MDHVKFCRLAEPFMITLEKMRLNYNRNRNIQRTGWYYVQLMDRRCSIQTYHHT